MKKIVLASALAMAMATPAFAHDWDESKMKEKFDMHDTNKDGALSMSEWNAAGGEMFKKADANGDGKVTFEEKKAFKEDKHDD